MNAYVPVLALNQVKVELKTSEKKGAESLGNIDLYQESYALVIGNDNYTNGWPRLSNGVKDAIAVADELTRQGYTVDLKTDLSAVELKSTLRNFFIMRGQNPEARLFLWYAGHGQTVKGEGFLVATDTPTSDKPDFKLSAIHMRDFGSWVRLAESKHVLAVFDSCFAGTIFTAQRGSPPPSITMATTYPVRQFLTSGDANQLVLDNGAFRELFVRALRGEERADINFDGYLTASELGFFISDRMTNLTQANQTPRYGKLRDKDYDRGDFIIAVLEQQNLLVDKSIKVQATETENLMWESVRQINTASAYQQYLSKYSRGMFTDLAKLQIETLNKKQQKQKKQLKQQKKIVVAKPSKPKEPTYNLQPLVKTVYATEALVAKGKPFVKATTKAVFEKGEQINVIAEVSGLSSQWLQVLEREQEVFISAGLVTDTPPKKSMAQLIKESKAQMGVNTDAGVSEYRQKQCFKDCEGKSYLDMNASTQKSMEDACSFSGDSKQYDFCIKQAKNVWRKSLLKSCESQCQRR
jgi:hypothetical protein